MTTTNDLLLGFDYGERQIGVAVGELATGSARPLCILPARAGQPDWSVLAGLLEEWQPGTLVVGLPLHMDGSEGSSAQQARKFAARLHGRFGCVVELHDERLSSHEVRARLREAAAAVGRRGGGNSVDSRAGGGTGGGAGSSATGNKKIAHNKIDALAAALILESWLAANAGATGDSL